jgi:Uma2 family endonuclease
MAVHSPRKLTYEDYERFPEDGQRHEILDGEHFVSASPATPHQLVFGAAFSALYVFVKERRLGRILGAPYDVVLSEHDVVVPDILFVSSDRGDIINSKNAQGAPDLVVEILSPSSRRRDKGLKLARYEKLGVVEYWILDPEAASVLVFRREGEVFLPPLHLSAENDERLTTPLLPGLELSLREVFEL